MKSAARHERRVQIAHTDKWTHRLLMYHCKAAASTSSEKNTENRACCQKQGWVRAHTRRLRGVAGRRSAQSSFFILIAARDYFHYNVGPPRPPRLWFGEPVSAAMWTGPCRFQKTCSIILKVFFLPPSWWSPRWFHTWINPRGSLRTQHVVCALSELLPPAYFNSIMCSNVKKRHRQYVFLEIQFIRGEDE